MAYDQVNIATSVTGGAGYIGCTRLPDGRLYAVFYDSTTTPKATKGYISVDEGATWNAESWAATIGAPLSTDGGNDPHVLSDPAGNVWFAMSNYDGNTIPTAIWRNEDLSDLGNPGTFFSGYIEFTQKTSVSYFSAAMDSAYTVSGIWNIACCFEKTGTLWYADVLQGVGPSTDVSVSTATTAITDCKLAITSGGTKNIAWVDNGSVWGSQKVGKLGSWSSPTKISDAAHTVQGLDWLAIQDTHQPAALYRMDNAGTTNLYLTEFDAGTNSWTRTRVWDGTNNYGFYSGSSLGYDSRGSVWILAMYDVGGLTRAEVTEFAMLRAVGATTFSDIPRTVTSGGDAPQCFVVAAHTPGALGYHPNQPYQGAVYLALLQPTTPSAQSFMFANRDTYTQAATAYPTIFSGLAGDLPYRAGDAETRTSVVFPGEGTAATTFPSILPDFDMKTHHVFETDTFAVKAGYTVRTSIMPSKRTLFDLAFDNRPEADKDTIRTFILARRKDKAPFDWVNPDSGDTLSVRVNTASIPFEKVWSDAYSLAFQLILVL